MITVDDARRAGFCLTGLKTWAEENGYDYRDLIKNGLPEQDLIDSGHEGLVKLIERARENG